MAVILQKLDYVSADTRQIKMSWATHALRQLAWQNLCGVGKAARNRVQWLISATRADAQREMMNLGGRSIKAVA